MKRQELVDKIRDIKRENAWSWRYICDQIGGVSDVVIISALLGQMKLVKPLAQRAADLFALTTNEKRLLNEVPSRGQGSSTFPSDPLLYRLHEAVMVYGPAWKELIEEEFGDGIMSAIDFDCALAREHHPKGDRVRLTLSGKFLPYKYAGDSPLIPEYGYAEDDLIER